METGIKPIVLEEIRMLAQKHKINKVILFGSRARGDYWRASDVDLAVQGGDIVNFALDVEENTSTLLQYDIVNYSEKKSEELRNEIERDGVILYEKI